MGSEMCIRDSNKVFKTTSKFEWILDGSWVDFRSILEAKLRPSWVQNWSHRASKPISKHGQKIDRKSGTQGHARACKGMQADATNLAAGP